MVEMQSVLVLCYIINIMCSKAAKSKTPLQKGLYGEDSRSSLCMIPKTYLSVLSGLLGGHSMAVMLKEGGQHMQWYQDELLHMAKDLGLRLLPAFNTSSGLPYPRVRKAHTQCLRTCCVVRFSQRCFFFRQGLFFRYRIKENLLVVTQINFVEGCC